MPLLMSCLFSCLFRCVHWRVHSCCAHPAVARCSCDCLIKQKAGAAAADDAADDEDSEDAAAQGANFDYLLDMALKSLTEEKVLHPMHNMHVSPEPSVDAGVQHLHSRRSCCLHPRQDIWHQRRSKPLMAQLRVQHGEAAQVLVTAASVKQHLCMRLCTRRRIC